MRMYANFIFLEEDILVFPHLIDKTLEIYKINTSSDGEPPVLTLMRTLGLPAMLPQAVIMRMACRAEPNPIGKKSVYAVPPDRQRPFRDSPADAVIIFSLLIQDALPLNLAQMHTFTFVVHRRSLLKQIDPTCSQVCPPAYAAVPAPWTRWGPSSTRWFDCGEVAMTWITTTAGQRYASMSSTSPAPICVRDFNPFRARALYSEFGDKEVALPNGNKALAMLDPTLLTCSAVFPYGVESALPYSQVTSKKSYPGNGVLMDEERIVLLQVR